MPRKQCGQAACLACGVHFQANLQNSFFYPLRSLCYGLPFQTGFKLYMVAHYCLAVVFMLLMNSPGLLRTGQAAICGAPKCLTARGFFYRMN